MTFYYKTYSWANNSSKGIPEETRVLWEHLSEKKNWRIVELPNGFYQAEYLDIKSLAEKGSYKEDVWVDVTRRETLESAEKAIDGSIEHYQKKLEFANGPKVVKTFE